jgi:RCC1 and BTB domain-containing protein
MGNLANSLVPKRVAGLPAPVRQVAAGDYHMGIVTEAGDLLMCGRGDYGRLGLGDQDGRTTPTLVARALFGDEAVLMVSCGFSHTVVATEGGGVYTFGRAEDGRLGHGNDENQLAPRRVPQKWFRPKGSPEGPGERVVMVAAGMAHTVALNEAGHVFTCGYGMLGQLGHGFGTRRESVPRQVEAGWFSPEGRPSGQGEKVVFVAAGGDHTVAVTEGGRLYTWGHGRSGQLGHGDTGNRLVPTLVGAGVFGAPEGGRVVMAACGNAHTLVVTQEGALWACGRGDHGQLGLNDRESRHAFVRVRLGEFGGARIVAAAAGDYHSAAVTEDGALWTWGQGNDGQLGHGDEENRLVPTEVSGAGLGGRRIGRCRGLPAEHALAFAMGTHGRLGGGGQAGGARRSSRLQGKAVAFAMGTHRRLGGGESMQVCTQLRQNKSWRSNQNLNATEPVDTSSNVLMLKEELVKMVFNIYESWAKGVTTREEGLGRLIGAGLIPRSLWPRPESIPEKKNSVTVKVCRPCNIVFS